jgi:hypothetical protein
MRGAGLVRQRRADPLGHAVKPLADGLVEFGLPGAEDLGHGPHPALHFGLRLEDLGKPRLRLGGAALLPRH